jgi:hypothetical protein
MTFKKMEGFNFVTLVTGLNRPNTGNEDGDDNSTLSKVALKLIKTKSKSK